MTNRFGNIKEQLSDGSTRIRFFGGLAVIVLASIVGYVSLRTSVSTTASGTASQVPPAPNVAGQRQHTDNGVPQATPVYDKLIEKENATAAANAKETGDSAVPVLRAGVGQKADAPAAAAPAPAQPAAASSQADAAAAQQRYQEELRRHQEAVVAKATSMKSQVNLLIASWQPKDHVTLTVREVAKDPSPASAGGTSSSASTGGTSSPASPASPERAIAKAGDTFYVNRETVVNGGGNPIVTAVIQNGALKGTRIIGKVELPENAESGVLKFTTANVPEYANSQAINAIAIDPGFIEVDHHYLMRYAAIFGSSFLSGFGEGLLKGGQQQQTIASQSGIVIQTDPYSTKQLVQIGIGNMGKTAGTNLGGIVNRPPTVKVNDAGDGSGFGIILMSDMVLK